MRFLKLMAIGVALLLLAGVVLGAACTGEAGAPGADGVGIENIVNNGDGTFTLELTDGSSYTTDDLTGPAGPQGEPGPNMIEAMGLVAEDASLVQGYNVGNIGWVTEYASYLIGLPDIVYDQLSYVTLVTPQNSLLQAGYMSASGFLVVTLRDIEGNPVKGSFSFMVLDTTPLD